MSTALKREPVRPSVGDAEYLRYSPLIRRIAKAIARRVPMGVTTVPDLIAYGWLGLLEANARAEATMSNEEFTAYASPRIRGAMLDFLRSVDPMARRVRAQSREIANAIGTLCNELGHAPEEEEIARSIHMSLDTYRKVLKRIADAGMARLDVMDYDDVESCAEPADDCVNRKMLIEAVIAALPSLPERLRLIVALHHQEDCTLQQIGDILGVTEARVCQLHSEAMHRLRAAIGKA